MKRGGVGLFRARYDDTQLKALVDTLRHLTVDFQDGKITEAALDRHEPDCVASHSFHSMQTWPCWEPVLGKPLHVVMMF